MKRPKKKIDLIKIIDSVWKANKLHSGIYKIAALTCMQKLQDIYDNKNIKCKNDFDCKIDLCELKECTKFEMK